MKNFFFFFKGVDKDSNFSSSKTRDLSKIDKLKRNRIGTIQKLKKKNPSSEPISFDEANSAKGNSNLPVLMLY